MACDQCQEEVRTADKQKSTKRNRLVRGTKCSACNTIWAKVSPGKWRKQKNGKDRFGYNDVPDIIHC